MITNPFLPGKDTTSCWDEFTGGLLKLFLLPLHAMQTVFCRLVQDLGQINMHRAAGRRLPLQQRQALLLDMAYNFYRL